jgi:predicted transcriptional regulator
MANLTIKVDDDLLKRARRKALAQGKSVEALLRRHFEQFASVDDQRQAGIDDLLALARASRAESGGRRWTRDELYDRR